MTNRHDAAAEVVRELEQMAKLGANVRKAIDYAKRHPKEMREYHRDGMSISEIADHCVTLASVLR